MHAAEKVRARADAEGRSLAGSVGPFAEYQQVLSCAARAAEEVARAAAKAPPLPVFAALPVAVSLVEEQRAANSASAPSPAVKGEVDLDVLAAAFTSGAVPSSPTPDHPTPPGVTAATVSPCVVRSEHHSAAAASGAVLGVSPMDMDERGSVQGDVVMEDVLYTPVQESAAASAGQATPSPPLASAEAVASDMAMLGSIVGGELGELDPVFYDTVPAQVWRLRRHPCLADLFSCVKEFTGSPSYLFAVYRVIQLSASSFLGYNCKRCNYWCIHRHVGV